MQVYFTVGISASGKSTWAKDFVHTRNLLFKADKTSLEFIEINRDEIRAVVAVEKGVISKVEDFTWDVWKWKWENRVTEIQKEKIDSAVASLKGIVISDTNLNYDRLVGIAKKFEEWNYKVKFVLFSQTFDSALKWDTARKNGVGVYVLRDQWKKFLDFHDKISTCDWFKKRIEHGTIHKQLKHVKSPDKKNVILFDIDGTVAHMNGRSPFEWDKVKEDKPDDLLSELIGMYLCVNSHKVIFLSGRDGVCYNETLEWIKKNIPNVRFTPNGNAELIMREANDTRKDWAIKQEIFFDKIDPYYNVIAVFDDRPQVVRMWHDIGLKVWACGDQFIDF